MVALLFGGRLLEWLGLQTLPFRIDPFGRPSGLTNWIESWDRP
ncbi:MAG: hypothetical protein ABJO09_14320 [Hyphomicrobiales bacterium]